MWLDLILSPSFKVKREQPNLKVLITLLIIGPRSLYCETNVEEIMGWESFDVVSDASRTWDTRYLASFSTYLQFGIFSAFGRRADPTCLQNGGAPIASRKSFNFIIMKAIFGHFFSDKCYCI